MNFVADESVDRHIVDKLRNEGHLIWYIAEMSPSITDNEVLNLAKNQKAPLLTSDKDFGELVFRQNLGSNGVILIRLSGLKPELKATIVHSVISKYEEELSGNFSVISPDTIRIRKLNI